jgi:hypothetical protein
MTSHFGQPARPISVATLWLLVACAAAEPEESALLKQGERGPAVLAHFGDTAAIEVPESTRVGEPTTVRITSFGGGCIRPDTTEAEVSGLSAVVRPYRVEPSELPPKSGCPLVLRFDRHTAQLRFSQPGRARVRILGLARPGDHPFVIERELQVSAS